MSEGLSAINNGDSGSSARSKINAVIAAVNGLVTPYVAYIEGNGNDGTAVIGDPTLPFQTAQAAITAAINYTEGGDCILSAGKGNFGAMDITGALSLQLIGVGATMTIFGAITSSTVCNLYGNGKENVQVGEVTFQPAAAANGNDGAPGAGEGNAAGAGGVGADAPQVSSMTVSGLYCTGNIILQAATGGRGGQGGNATGSAMTGVGGNGGTGGLGGTLTVQDCTVDSYVVSVGGNGGQGGQGGNSTDSSSGSSAGGDGGTGGAAGSVVLVRTQAGGFFAGPSSGGNGGIGGTNTGTSPNGNAGAAGAAGSITTRFCQVTDPANGGETTAYWVSLINDSFFPNP
jgi:hypothetical protein